MVTSGVVVTWESVCIIRQSEYIFRLEFCIISNLCQLSHLNLGTIPFSHNIVVLLLGESPGRVVVFEIDLINV